MKTAIVKIYSLDDPETGEVRYIGKTIKKLSSRLKGHINDDQKNHKVNWIKSLSIRGLKPLISEIEVLNNPSEHEWQDAEKFWIETLRFCGCRLTNLCAGGQGPSNPSPESREKMSAWQRGKSFSEEHRKKMSLAAKGRMLSEETKLKMSLARKGSKQSPETRAKLSASCKGRKLQPHVIEIIRNCRLGSKRSPEAIAKWKETYSKNEPFRKRRPITETERLRLSMLQKGRKQTPETIAKRIASFKLTCATNGKRPNSPEACARQAEKIRGRKQSPEAIEKMVSTQKQNRELKKQALEGCLINN